MHLVIVLAAALILSPLVLQAQGEITVESLASRVAALQRGHNQQEQTLSNQLDRIRKLEAEVRSLKAAGASTPEPAKTATPDATATKVRMTVTAQAQAGATVRAQANSTATAVARQTITARRRAEATANAKATERAPVIATTEARLTATAQAKLRRESQPQATPTPVGGDYREKVNLIMTGDGTGGDIVSALYSIGDAFSRASRQPDLLLDGAWKMEVTVAVASLKLNYQDAKKLTPPPSLRRFHNLVIEGLSYCDMAGDQITRGLDQLDAELLLDAGDLINLCNGILIRASEDPNW